MSEEKYPVLQGHLNNAFAKWENDMGKDEYFKSLDGAEAVATYLGKMNYQVENGGWLQWWDNGYATEHVTSEIAAILVNIRRFISNMVNSEDGGIERLQIEREHEAVLAVYSIFGKLEPYIQDWIEAEAAPYDEVDEYVYQSADHLCNAYYDVNENFLAAVERYLSATYGEPVNAA